MNLRHLSKTATLLNFFLSLPLYISGFKLLKKPIKTMQEAEAARSFKKLFLSISLMILLWLLALAIGFIHVFSNPLSDDTQRAVNFDGTVRGGNVEYMFNDTEHFISLNHPLLSQLDLKDFDNVLLVFDISDHRLTRAIPDVQHIQSVEIQHSFTFNGYVRLENVEFMINAKKHYISLSNPVLKALESKDFEGVLLVFDITDSSLIKAVPESQKNKEMKVLVLSILIPSMMLIAAMIVLPRTIGKKWLQWSASNRDE